MNRQTKDRLLLPVGVPLFSLLVIGFVLFAFSRILLAVPHEMATPIALAMALNVLTGAALIASLPRLRSRTLIALLTAGAIVLAGGAVTAMAVSGELEDLLTREPEVAAQEEEPAAEPTQVPTETAPAEEPTGAVAVTAKDLTFSTDELTFLAGRPVTLTFENADAIAHSVAIYTRAGGEALFTGEVFPGPATREYAIPALDAGTYHFQCDVHPAMNGTVRVA